MSAERPHDGVYARLGVSRIHGIGAFAIRPIPAGTNVFANDQRDIHWIDAAIVDSLPEDSAARRFYVDFGIRRDGRIGVPANFNLLTVGWYLNEPASGEEANVAMTEDFQILARRDIAEGEELTLRYAGFSEPSA